MRFPQGSERGGWFFWGSQVCPGVSWSEVCCTTLLQVTGDGLLVNTRLTEGTGAHGHLAYQSPFSMQPLWQSTSFKGNVTLAYLLTANGGGAGLDSTQTVKSNINLIQTSYNFILAWEQLIHRDIKSEKAPKIHKALWMKPQFTYKLLTTLTAQRPNNKTKTWVSGNRGEISVNLK